jgi:hypothetical protein
LIVSGPSKPTLRRRAGRPLYVDATLCVLLLFLCPTGDFGRVRPSLLTDDMNDWVGRAAVHAEGTEASQFPLTDDERLLRNLAYPLIEPGYLRHPATYATYLMTSFVRSETTRYARLNERIRSDIDRIDPFFTVARRVVDIDHKREQSLGYVSAAGEPEVANALSRVNENILTVAWVQQSLIERAAAYRFALERLVIMTPSPMAAEVERSLTLLQTRTAANVVVAAPDLAAASPPPALRPPPSPRARAPVPK